MGSSGLWRTAGTHPLQGKDLVGGEPTAPQASQAPGSVPLHSLPQLHSPLLALTELVEVRVTRHTWHRAHQPRLQESGPLVDQAALPTHVILWGQ